MSDDHAPDYADSLEANMLADYVSTGMTLTRACAVLGIARRQDIYERMDASARFRDMMEKARTDGYDALADECVVIADDDTRDVVESVDMFGRPRLKLDKDNIQRAKLRVETRMKLLAKWHPKKYGEKLEIESRAASVAIPVGDDPIAAQKAYEELMKGN